MTFRTVEINVGRDLWSELKIPVTFTDELVVCSIYDLAFDSRLGNYLPYLFVGYFYSDQLQRWFFSNCRRHEELKQAVESTIGDQHGYIYGQMWFNSTNRREGELLIERLNLNEPLPDHEALNLFRQSINPADFDPNFVVTSNS